MRVLLVNALIVVLYASVSYGQANTSEMVTSFAWLVLAVSGLLIAVGALIVFVKLAKFIDRLEEYLKKK